MNKISEMWFGEIKLSALSLVCNDFFSERKIRVERSKRRLMRFLHEVDIV